MGQRLQAAETAKITRLYLDGMKPSAIARRMGLKSGTVRQLLWRNGWSEIRAESESITEQVLWEMETESQEGDVGTEPKPADAVTD